MALDAGNKIVNTNTGTVAEGYDISGGYFVIDALNNIPNHTKVTGALCYCQADSKFYQYNGSSWTETAIGQHNSHGVTVISGKKSDGTTDITASSTQSTSGLHSVTLADSGAAVGAYGDTSNQTPNYGDTFKVPSISVNAKGIVTAVGEHTVKIPASDNTNDDHYPTTFTWTDGTSAGPTGSLTGNSGFSAVSFGAIPSAGASASGIVTTGTQTFAGEKTFSSQVTAPSFYANSDKRLKENIVEYVPSKSILDLPIYKFDFIDGAKNQVGCLAQDLQEICPEIVQENQNGFLSIQESKIVYLLIDEIKKLKLKIEELEKKDV